MSDYITKLGTVQFDVSPKSVNGKDIREATIRDITSPEGNLIRCTIWDNYPASSTPINKGDLLVVDGKSSVNTVPQDDGTTKTYYNLSAVNLVVIAAAVKSETTVAVNTAKPPVSSVFWVNGFQEFAQFVHHHWGMLIFLSMLVQPTTHYIDRRDKK